MAFDHSSFPLSFTQQRLWLLHQYQPHHPALHQVAIVRFTGTLQPAELTRSLTELVRRHTALRVSFPNVDNEPLQHIQPPYPVPLTMRDLRAFDETARDTEIDRCITQETARPFDLQSGLLLRAILLRLTNQEYLLHLMMHGLAADARAMEVFIRELCLCYAAFTADAPSPLMEPAAHYTEYAEAQRAWWMGPSGGEAREYWRRYLAEAPTALELPIDMPRPPVQSIWRARHPFVLPPSLSAGLHTLSHGEDVSLFTILLSAWQTLLARYTMQEDIVVGVQVENRADTLEEAAVGPFADTLVARTDLTGNPCFRDLLHRVQSQWDDAETCGHIPFALLEARNRDPSRHPLVQIGFSVRHAPTQTTWTLPGLAVRAETVPPPATAFDLSLALLKGESGLHGVIEYSRDLFKPSTIARMAGHFETLLAGIVTAPTMGIRSLPLLTEEERRQLLMTWNDTQREFSRDACVHHLFEDQVARTPNAIAVNHGADQVTYGQLNARANQLARYLQTRGAGPEVAIAIFMEPSVDLIVGMLAILKAGSAYVPLDPAYPRERIAFMLEATQAPLLLTHERLCGSLPTYATSVICVDAEARARGRAENPATSVCADNLVYVMFTSGSTGTPKGVLVTHRNLVHSAQARLHYYHDPVKAFLMLSSFSFDSSVNGTFWTLLQGGTLTLPTVDFQRDLRELANLIPKSNISHLSCIPSLYTLILAHASDDQLKGLRTVVVAGEVCPRSLVTAHFERLSHVLLFNEYGPTEGTVWSHVYQCQPNESGMTVPIGRTISNMRGFLLDRYLQLVPVGVPGELHIAGEGLARGYLNHPDLTAERFIPHPFPLSPGERLYKTGDLARALPNGNIEILGRLDDQVKIRGFRVELGEVETVLRSHPAVRETVVVAREDQPDDRRLVGYVVARAGHQPTIAELRAFLRERLPEYMIPSAIVLLDDLPLNPHGKVDRRALLAPDSARTQTNALVIPPRDEVERWLVGIWEELLGTRVVSVTDDFFTLGGHSLLAARLADRVQREFDYHLPLSIFVQRATVRQLAALLHNRTGAEEWSPLVNLSDPDSGAPLFLVHPTGGSILCYLALARYLGATHPCYGLQARAMHGNSERARIEDMAASYLDAIRAVQACGPYLLGGWSAGGIIAFEMAQQLFARGEEVALLALLDIHAPTPDVFRRQRTGFVKINVIKALHTVFGSDPNNPALLRAGSMLRLDRGSVEDLDHAKAGIQMKNALATYAREGCAQRYPGQIALFRAATVATESDMKMKATYGRHVPDCEERHLDRTMGWDAIATYPVEVFDVPGTHATMVAEPHVRHLAELLDARLARADAITPPTAADGE